AADRSPCGLEARRPVRAIARDRGPRDHRGERRGARRDRARGRTLLRRVILLLLRAPPEPLLLRPSAAFHRPRQSEPLGHRRSRAARAAWALHRALRRDHVALVPARPTPLRRASRRLRRALAEPLADLRAERRNLLPARQSAHLLLGRLRLVPG